MNIIYQKRSIFSFLSLSAWLIILNALLFFVFSIILIFNKDFVNLIAVQPAQIMQGKSLWTIFTSMFMHAGIFHLFVNMFSLFFLGRFAEKLVGRKRFFWLYIISGLVGSAAFVLFACLGAYFPFGENAFGSMQDSAVGASGALFGLLGLLAMLIPFHAVYLIAGPLIVIVLQIALDNILTGSAGSIFSFAATILLFIMIFAMFSPNPRFRRISLPIKMPLWVAPIAAIVPLVLISLFVKLPIGNSAHLGGLLVGLVYGLYLRKKYKKKIVLLQRYFR